MSSLLGTAVIVGVIAIIIYICEGDYREINRNIMDIGIDWGDEE